MSHGHPIMILVVLLMLCRDIVRRPLLVECILAFYLSKAQSHFHQSFPLPMGELHMSLVYGFALAEEYCMVVVSPNNHTSRVGFLFRYNL